MFIYDIVIIYFDIKLTSLPIITEHNIRALTVSVIVRVKNKYLTPSTDRDSIRQSNLRVSLSRVYMAASACRRHQVAIHVTSGAFANEATAATIAKVREYV